MLVFGDLIFGSFRGRRHTRFLIAARRLLQALKNSFGVKQDRFRWLSPRKAYAVTVGSNVQELEEPLNDIRIIFQQLNRSWRRFLNIDMLA